MNIKGENTVSSLNLNQNNGIGYISFCRNFNKLDMNSNLLIFMGEDNK